VSRSHSFFLCFFLVVLVGCSTSFAQNNNNPQFPFPDRDGRRNDDDAKVVKDMLAKQQAERDKKEHEEMMKRAEEALTLTNELDKAFEEHETISPKDEKKLVELEKLVRKIRGELGGDDDGDSEANAADDEPKPSTLKAAFDALKSTTTKLVDELKKTTRFSISAVAIQSSNTVIKIIRFLRFKN